MESNEFSELLNQRILRHLKNPSEVVQAKGIERGNHREPPDELGNQPELFEVFWLDLPQEPITHHLAVFRHPTEAKTAPPETLGDDVFQPDECPAADEQDIGRVEGDAGLCRMLPASLGRNRDDREPR